MLRFSASVDHRRWSKWQVPKNFFKQSSNSFLVPLCCDDLAVLCDPGQAMILHHRNVQPAVDFVINLNIWHDGAPQIGEPMDNLQLSYVHGNVGDTLPRCRLGCICVFFKLNSNPKNWAASKKQEVMYCKALSVWTTRAASSAKLRSQISCSRVFVWACVHRNLNRMLSRLYLR